MKRLLSDYGMLGVLVLLCAVIGVGTIAEQHPEGAEGAALLAETIRARFPAGSDVLIVAPTGVQDRAFAEALPGLLPGYRILETVVGEPRDGRLALERHAAAHVIACTPESAAWEALEGTVPRLAPAPFRGSRFLKRDNLLNVLDQIAVIAILAVGMTLVIICGGVDLSVGSLIALSAVTATLLIREAAGAQAAGPASMIACGLAALALCTLMGVFNGAMVTVGLIPPFIVTLAMMFMARGAAYLLSNQRTISELPDGFMALGRGALVPGLPNAVALMLGLYAGAHLLMSRTTLGRHLYAVGGNAEAARLSGVPVTRVRIFAYSVCGATAALGGLLMASRLKTGSANFGDSYELYTIAAVVVGGASLSGGEGKILGTLVGSLIIAVIQNGMNLWEIKQDWQRIVFGGVILAAALVDRHKRR